MLPPSSHASCSPQGPRHQRGALMVLVLLVLLVVSLLGMSTMDATGLEMQMSSNSREQQQTFEAAEYALSWLQNDIQTNPFTDASLNNSAACGTVCFDATCSNGYCFDDMGIITNVPSDAVNCELGSPITEPYQFPETWNANAGDGRHHQSLVIPATDFTANYIVEFRCYARADQTQPLSNGNAIKIFRITVFVTGQSGRTRAMLRSTIQVL